MCVNICSIPTIFLGATAFIANGVYFSMKTDNLGFTYRYLRRDGLDYNRYTLL